MPQHHCTGRPACEALERRQFLSADVVAGTLVVRGTDGPDGITMWGDARFGSVIMVRIVPLMSGQFGEAYAIPEAGVRSVLVLAGAGDDRIALSVAMYGPTTGPIAIPTRVSAGPGDDVVSGTNARDLIFGGPGNDRINGWDGSDWIDGGPGDDILSGGRGNDYVSGGDGDDVVQGNEGDDRLSGGPGNDHVGFMGVRPLASEPGNDVLSGGSGEDWMIGGEGEDRIAGGTGRDHYSAADDESEMLDRTPDEPKDIPVSR
jgi:Ca2+-binding RTX toxin-like protein